MTAAAPGLIPPLILASKSASRRAMLDAAGVAYEAVPADIDERAVEAGSGKSKNYALYKLSWCDYNVQEYAEGIKKLKTVISESERAGKEAVQLKNEALGDLSRFFSYVDETDTAFEYFREKGGEDIALRYTARLSELFHEQGKWDLEIKTYRMLIVKYPNSARAPAFQTLRARGDLPCSTPLIPAT
jgi:tetratricopeptide (TPR) repeat protein